MFVPFHGDGIISQFEGYEDLQELDWDAYRAKYGTSSASTGPAHPGQRPQPLQDRQAGRHGDAVLPGLDGELRRLFERLGYAYGPDTALKDFDYYDERTSHRSTLSFVAYGGVLAPLDAEGWWERFLAALESDVATSRAAPRRRAFTWA